MAKNKTTKTSQSVYDFLKTVESETKRDDSRKLIKMMSEITGEKPYMYGPSIIGFGNYHYKYDSGHEGDAPIAGFSPRKASISLYLSSQFPGRDKMLKKLGKCKVAVSCVYVNKLADIDEGVLREMVVASVEEVKKTHQC